MPTHRLTFAALVSGHGWHVQDLLRASEKFDIRLEPIGFETLVGVVGVAGRVVESGGVPLASLDGLLVRMMPPGSLEQVIYRMDALQRLERRGIRVLNTPKAVEVSVDKYLSLALIEAAGLPVPPTFAGESSAQAMEWFESLGGDIVVKPLFGSEGRGIMRVSDRELAVRAFTTLERLGSVIYAQQAIRHPGHDIRAFVLGSRVVGAIRRFATQGEWRTNVALGGRPEACRLDPRLEALALAAARAVGAEMAGVDLLMDLDRDEPVVLEVNAVPGWRALAGATGIDIAIEILDYLIQRRSPCPIL